MKLGSILAFSFLLVVACGHLLRLIFRIPLDAGGVLLPMWPSVVAFVAPVTICWLLWREGDR